MAFPSIKKVFGSLTMEWHLTHQRGYSPVPRGWVYNTVKILGM